MAQLIKKCRLQATILMVGVVSAYAAQPVTVELKLSQPLTRPDGMRAIGKNRLLMAENSGNMDIVTFSGQNAEIKTIKSGLEATPAVTATRGLAWIAKG